MHFVAVGTPVSLAAMLGDDNGRVLDFDLLEDMGRFFGEFDGSAAMRTTGQSIVFDFIDLAGLEGRTLMALMSGLAAPFAFLFLPDLSVSRGGLTISLEGFLEELAEFLRALANSSAKRAISALRAAISTSRAEQREQVKVIPDIVMMADKLREIEN